MGGYANVLTAEQNTRKSLFSLYSPSAVLGIRDCRTDLAQNRGMKAKTQDLDLPAAVALRKKIGPSLAKRHSEVSEGRIETVMGGVHGVNLNVIFVYNCAIHQVRARRLHILETLSLCP